MASCILELRTRVELLEATQHAHIEAAQNQPASSLVEQALEELCAAERLYPADWSTIRRALEQLDD
jgi:hypothetical protein